MRVQQEDEVTHEAVAEVVKSTEKWVVGQLTLLRHDMVDEARRFGAQIAQNALGLLFAFGAWVAISVGLGLSLAEVMPPGPAALCLGAGYLALAGGLFWHAKRQRERGTTAS